MITPEPFDLSLHLLPVKNIPAETRRRLATDEFVTVSPKVQSEYEDDGWVLDRRLKLKVKMRRRKRHDVAFEDRVWAAMAKLNFPELNKDRHLRLPYGSTPAEAQQVDVLAADDEVVLLIACKSTGSATGSTFKKDIEAIQARRAGMLSTLKERYPNHKVKFIFATNNFGVSADTEQRFLDTDIVHMDEEAIEYFLSLAEHLGRSARYQLHGYLFGGSKIPGIESTVAALRGKMGGYKYYSFAIEPARLLKLTYVLHRNRANNLMMPTYQRLIKKTRLRSVAQFVDGGGFFPNSVIINIEPGRRPLRFDRAELQSGDSTLGILHLPQTYRAAYIIDGQHRLYGYANSKRADTDLIPVVAFEGLPRSEQVRLFMQINENQQAVPKNLRSTLNADLLWDSGDLREQARALRLRIAQQLGEHKASPLYGRVIIGENSRSMTRCITIDAISGGLERGNFIGSFTKNEMKALGTFYRGTNDATFAVLPRFLEQCFSYLRDALPVQWSLGASPGGFVFINSGVESLIRLFSDIVDHLVATHGIRPAETSLDALISLTQTHLDPVIAFLNGLDSDDAAEFRRLYGSGGPSRYWRRLQSALNEADPDFAPPGLAEYLKDQEKQFNAESFAMIRELEDFLKTDVRRRLQDKYGPRWKKDGVPLKVIQDATQLSLEKNRSKDIADEVEDWDCLHLIDYRTIFQKDHAVWSEVFMKQYTRPGEETKPGGWKARSDWLVELNQVRNKVAHGETVTEQEYEFLVSLSTWLVHGQVDADV